MTRSGTRWSNPALTGFLIALVVLAVSLIGLWVILSERQGADQPNPIVDLINLQSPSAGTWTFHALPDRSEGIAEYDVLVSTDPPGAGGGTGIPVFSLVDCLGSGTTCSHDGLTIQLDDVDSDGLLTSTDLFTISGADPMAPPDSYIFRLKWHEDSESLNELKLP